MRKVAVLGRQADLSLNDGRDPERQGPMPDGCSLNFSPVLMGVSSPGLKTPPWVKGTESRHLGGEVGLICREGPGGVGRCLSKESGKLFPQNSVFVHLVLKLWKGSQLEGYENRLGGCI